MHTVPYLVAPRAMRERALERDDNPTSPAKASTEVFFVSGRFEGFPIT